MRRLIQYIGVLLLCCIVLPLSGQIDKQQTYEEEIIRYLGYEEIPVRYLSLPYDVTMGHNVTRHFMDIGFMLLMFIPLIFLWRAKKTAWRIVMALLIGLMSLLAIGSSHVLDSHGGKLFNGSELMTNHIEGLEGQPIRKAIAQVYQFCGELYQPIGQVLADLTENGDQFTYLLLLGLIYFMYFVYSRSSNEKNEGFLLGILLLFYCFFMLVLSAGIIWYGFLMFPLLFLEIAKYIKKSAFYNKIFLSAAGIFIVLAYFLKVSNLNILNETGNGMLQTPVLSYNFSGDRGNELYEGYYANVGPALDRINSTDGLVFQAGTSLAYLIDKNNERVFKDGILHIFNQLVDRYKRKSTVNEALKASGFKYLIVSPNIINVDQTPGKTLTSKFQKLLGYVHDNPNLKLLGTDRRVRVQNENGELVEKFDFLYGNDVLVLNTGSYAIFEIQ